MEISLKTGEAEQGNRPKAVKKVQEMLPVLATVLQMNVFIGRVDELTGGAAFHIHGWPLDETSSSAKPVMVITIYDETLGQWKAPESAEALLTSKEYRS